MCSAVWCWRRFPFSIGYFASDPDRGWAEGSIVNAQASGGDEEAVMWRPRSGSPTCFWARWPRLPSWSAFQRRACGTMNNLSFRRRWRESLKRLPIMETIAYRMGASAKGDGYESNAHAHDQSRWNTPVEAFEHQYPTAHRELSGAQELRWPGIYCKAMASYANFVFLTPAEVTVLSTDRVRGPYGLKGRGSSNT